MIEAVTKSIHSREKTGALPYKNTVCFASNTFFTGFTVSYQTYFFPFLGGVCTVIHLSKLRHEKQIMSHMKCKIPPFHRQKSVFLSVNPVIFSSTSTDLGYVFSISPTLVRYVLNFSTSLHKI